MEPCDLHTAKSSASRALQRGSYKMLQLVTHMSVHVIVCEAKAMTPVTEIRGDDE